MKAGEVVFAILNRGIFKPRVYQAVVPNVSWGFFSNHEADLVLVSKAGYLTEVEIKVSKSDFEKDYLKRKWHPSLQKGSPVKFFYYAMPKSVWDRSDQSKARPEAGVIVVEKAGTDYKATVIREATATVADKINERQIKNLLRLCCLKFWSRYAVDFTNKELE